MSWRFPLLSVDFIELCLLETSFQYQKTHKEVCRLYDIYLPLCPNVSLKSMSVNVTHRNDGAQLDTHVVHTR